MPFGSQMESRTNWIREGINAPRTNRSASTQMTALRPVESAQLAPTAMVYEIAGFARSRQPRVLPTAGSALRVTAVERAIFGGATRFAIARANSVRLRS